MLIGELADNTGVTTKTLRFYERQGLVPTPDRTEGGYRDYARATVEGCTATRPHGLDLPAGASRNVVRGERVTPMTTETTLQITGMDCGHCAARLGQSMERLDGVIWVEVDHPAGAATVRYDEERLSEDDLGERVRTGGFDLA